MVRATPALVEKPPSSFATGALLVGVPVEPELVGADVDGARPRADAPRRRWCSIPYAEVPESIAGEPAFTWKLPLAGSTNCGFTPSLLPSEARMTLLPPSSFVEACPAVPLKLMLLYHFVPALPPP